MNPEDEKYSKSPHKPLMGSREFPSGTSFMDDATFSASPLCSSFPSPLAEFETFSALNPSNYPPSQTVEFKANLISETAPTRPSRTGGDASDEVEENIGVPQPLECLHGTPVPPFLSKTFDLVDDRFLDPIISWGHTGESFVVRDPVEFSRLVLPRNFKHNNFSSFVRQLNTYGFRKIHTDRWEFANEAFRRGEKHLLKNIQRRKSPQTQQIGSYTGPSTEAGKLGPGNEVESLKKERSMLLQEVVELQQQQHGTVHHMAAVNQRIQAAEQKQKQTVSFLAKLFQSSSFLARLRQNKEQGGSSSSKIKRVKHEQQELHQLESSMDGQIVKYRPAWRNLTFSPVVPNINPAPVESQEHASQGMIGSGQGGERLPFQMENIPSNEFFISDELAVSQGFMKNPEQAGEELLSLHGGEAHFKGKSVVSPEQEVVPECFVPYADELAAENISEFLPVSTESIAEQEYIWSMGFDTHAAVPASSNELWGTLANYDVPELVSTGGFSDIWDIGSVAGGSEIDRWQASENPLDEPRSDARQLKDNKLEDVDP